jgi:hypothetical protein
MTTGVTGNGVQYYQIAESEFMCVLYLGEGIEKELHLTDSTITRVRELTMDDFFNEKKTTERVTTYKRK